MHRTLPSHRRQTLFALAAVTTSSIALTGCSAEDQPPPVARTTALRTPTGSPAATPTGDPLGDPFAERTAIVDGTAMRLEMFPIRRSEGVATMTARLMIERAGDVIIVSCLFGAPAASTRAVDVQTVNFGNYHDVPLV